LPRRPAADFTWSPAVTRQPVVEIRNASRSFRSPEGSIVRAVEDISLDIEAGKFTTLLGPSGCGKTTLLRMIGGFEDPDQGTIAIDGSDMTDRPPFERPVNTVFQQYALFPHLTVAENIAYGLSVTGIGKTEIARRTTEALKMVRLEGMGSRPIRKISGGQQQRVALARALILRPKVLLLDEPLAALDRRLRKDMQFELKKLQHELGIAFLCVTHDQEEALAMSDRIVVMNAGRIEQAGTPWEIYQRPLTRFTAGFVGEMNFIVATAAETDNGITRYAARSEEPNFYSRLSSASGAAVVLAIRPEHLKISERPPQLPAFGRSAKIIDSSYLGTSTRLEVSSASMTLHIQLEGSRFDGKPGDTLWIEYDPKDVLVLAP
jgi:spermidine/putrescine transport system ATP-binding protein